MSVCCRPTVQSRLEVKKSELPMAFAVAQALKETRTNVLDLFKKYDMNGDRSICANELGPLLQASRRVVNREDG